MRRPKNHGEPWTNAEISQLGTASDSVVAQQIGRTRKAVEAKRRDLGITPATPHQRDWPPDELRLLGTISDSELAARLGISRRCVLKARQRLGIEAYSQKNRP